MPNCITKAKSVRTRTFIGDQIDDCKDLSGLFYLLPFQKVRYYICGLFLSCELMMVKYIEILLQQKKIKKEEKKEFNIHF